MWGRIVKALTGVKGLLKEELREEAFRHRFSDYLPWVAYDPELKVYLNQDQSVGFLWSCTPLGFASQSDFETLAGLFRIASIPEFSVLQFWLYADPYIEPILDWYQELKVKAHQSELVRKAVERNVTFIRNGTDGLDVCQGIPVRHFKLLVSLKMPLEKLPKSQGALEDIRASVKEILKAVGLAPREVEPDEFISMMFRLFNGYHQPNLYWDPSRPISHQVLLASSTVECKWNEAKVGPYTWRCLTPKQMPREVGPLTMNILTGDIWGVQSDMNQIPVPFILVVNIVYQKLKTKLHSKCNFVLQQHAFGSLTPSLRRKQEEYLWATDEIERGTTFVRVMPIVWVYHEDPQVVRDALARTKRIWEAQGFTMQEDNGILKILFIASMPFGLYTQNGTLDLIDRDFICHDMAASYILPIQADCPILSAPHVLFIGRKGQLIPVDLFDPRSNNMNAFVAAETGSGKSFLVNHLVFNYYASGAMIRIVDIGGSYKKLCQMLGGKFLNFDENSKIVLNPFGSVNRLEDDLGVLSAIVAQMAYSATEDEPDEIEMSLIKAACMNAWRRKGKDATVDDVHLYLSSFPQMAENEDLADEILGLSSDHMKELVLKARRLAYNLQDFTSSGIYGRWFCGKTNIDISKDDFVVLELEELKPKRELFKVVVLQLMNYVTMDLFLSDRSRPRLIIFDEAWQFMRDSGFMAQVIEEGYRRARKYGGSFITITQSLLDLKAFGRVGEVVLNNSAWKFMLQSSDYEKARAEKIIDLGDFETAILKSVKNARPKYSEVFVQTPIGRGVMRLVVDRFTYYLYTTDARDVSMLNEVYRRTGSWEKAIEELLAEQQVAG